MKTSNFQRIVKGTKKSTMLLAAVAFATSVSFTSCNKDDAPGADLSLQNETAQVISPGATATFTGAAGSISRGSGANNGIYTVANYFIDNGILSGTGYHIPNGFYYFDLSENDNAPVPTGSTTPTVSWDIAFGGTGNAYITVNSGVRLKAIDKAFASVTLTDTTAATLISIAAGGFGHDGFLAPGTPSSDVDPTPASITGWANYWFDQHTLIKIANRTLIFKDAAGNVYAFDFESVYENATPIPGASGFPDNYSRLHFRYKKLN